jgi:hypothetical protein
MKAIILFSIFIISTTFAKDIDFIKTVFSKASRVESISVVDNISENPINTTVFKVFDLKNNFIGYYRKVITTTGCNSACLPIHVTLFYEANKTFKTLKSKKGLTKRNHVAFTDSDYNELELILNLNPVDLKKVNHPKDMVDVITGQTTKEYTDDVVKEAAYTSLRINKYNQDTLKQLGGI